MQNITKRLFVLIVVVALILLISLIAMQFTEEVNWSLGDFVVMGALLFGAGLILDLVMRKTSKYRIVGAIAVIAAFLYIWAELAVGIFTSWGS